MCLSFGEILSQREGQKRNEQINAIEREQNKKSRELSCHKKMAEKKYVSMGAKFEKPRKRQPNKSEQLSARVLKHNVTLEKLNAVLKSSTKAQKTT